MKIIYIANARIPTEKAHGVQIMQMCEAISKLGHDIALLLPLRINKIKTSPFEFYNIKPIFKIKKLFSIDLLPIVKIFGKAAFYVQNWSFAARVLVYCFFHKTDFIFSRDLMAALALGMFKKKVFYEIHDSLPVNFFTKKFLKNIAGFVSTNEYKKKETTDNFKINENKILVAPNGVDLEKFEIKHTQEECRKILNLPLEKKIAVYAGSKLPWKGAEIVEEAAKILREYNIEALIVCGKPYKDIPLYLKAADVLILPNTRKEKISEYETSPIKLFEYMASGRPIIASNLPSIREIAGEKEVFYIEPDSATELVGGIRKLLGDKGVGEDLAKNAEAKVKNYTWVGRGEKILNFLMYGTIS